MSRMVRKQVYIEARQDAVLKRRARQLGITEAELVRRAIDQAARSPINLPRDLTAWEEEKAFIEQRLRMDVPQTGRDWKREELYEERLGRYSS